MMHSCPLLVCCGHRSIGHVEALLLIMSKDEMDRLDSFS